MRIPPAAFLVAIPVAFLPFPAPGAKKSRAFLPVRAALPLRTPEDSSSCRNPLPRTRRVGPRRYRGRHHPRRGELSAVPFIRSIRIGFILLSIVVTAVVFLLIVTNIAESP